jgi:hypothetical protein
MTTCVTFFDGCAITKWQPTPFLWFCYKEGDDNKVVIFLYGGGVVEKVMVGGGFFLCGAFGLVH